MSFETVGMLSRGRMANSGNKMTHMSLPISIAKNNNPKFAAIERPNSDKYERPFSNCGLVDVKDPSAFSRMSSQANKYNTLWAYAVPADAPHNQKMNMKKDVNAKQRDPVPKTVGKSARMREEKAPESQQTSLASKIAAYEAKWGPLSSPALSASKSSASTTNAGSSTLKSNVTNVTNTMQPSESAAKPLQSEQMTRSDMQDMMQQLKSQICSDIRSDIRSEQKQMRNELAAQFAKQDKAVNDKMNDKMTPFNEGLNRLVERVERHDQFSNDMKKNISELKKVKTVNANSKQSNMDFLRGTMPARVACN